MATLPPVRICAICLQDIGDSPATQAPSGRIYCPACVVRSGGHVTAPPPAAVPVADPRLPPARAQLDRALVDATRSIRGRRGSGHSAAPVHAAVTVAIVVLIAGFVGAGLWVQRARQRDLEVRKVVARAKQLGTAEQWDAANRILDDAVQSYPARAEALRGLKADLLQSRCKVTLARAETAIQRNDLASAMQLLDEVRLFAPDVSVVNRPLGRVHKQAQARIANLLEEADRLTARERWSEAEEAVAAAERVLVELRLTEEAFSFDLAARRAAIRVASDQKLQNLADAIISSIDAEKFDDARKGLDLARKQFPDRTDVLDQLASRAADAQSLANELRRAIEAADQELRELAERVMEVTARAKQYPASTLGVSLVLSHRAQGDEGRAWFKEQIALGTNSVPAVDVATIELIRVDLDGAESSPLQVLDALGRLAVLDEAAIAAEVSLRALSLARAVQEVATLCPHCAGVGNIACAGCGGTPRREVRVPCPGCQGRLSVDCPVCEDRRTKCLQCGGDGEVKRTVRAKSAPPFTTKRVITQRCDRCYGTGTVRCTNPACRADGSLACTQCEKTGSVPAIEICRDCRGASTPVTCGPCTGTGRRGTVQATVDGASSSAEAARD